MKVLSSARQFLVLALATLTIVTTLILVDSSNLGEEKQSSLPHHVIETDDGVFANAFANKLSNIDITGEAIVVKLLTDDTRGSKHQRFIVELDSGQTILIAHNIDLAPRVNILQIGDIVSFKGVYEFNDKGGVIHWTHHDPKFKRDGGWIKHNGKIYK